MDRIWNACLLAGALLAAPVAAEDSGTDTANLKTATFSMYCYWTGEATLGRVDGVVASRIGHWGGNEIVQVDYDAAKTDLRELAGALAKQRSFYSLLVRDPAEKERTVARLGTAAVTVRDGTPRFIEPKHSLRTRHPPPGARRLGLERAAGHRAEQLELLRRRDAGRAHRGAEAATGWHCRTALAIAPPVMPFRVVVRFEVKC